MKRQSLTSYTPWSPTWPASPPLSWTLCWRHLHQHVAEQTHRQLKRLTGQFKTKYDKDLCISSKHICDIMINIYVFKMNKLFWKRKHHGYNKAGTANYKTGLCGNIFSEEIWFYNMSFSFLQSWSLFIRKIQTDHIFWKVCVQNV